MVSRRHRRNAEFHRDPIAIASRPDRLVDAFLTPVRLSSLSLDNVYADLSDRNAVIRSLDDRRAFHPDNTFRPVQSPTRWQRALLMGASRYHFRVPDKVTVCVRRKERREVLFATGGRSRVRRKKRYNYWSSVKC